MEKTFFKKNILILSETELSFNDILTKVLNKQTITCEPLPDNEVDKYKDSETELFNRHNIFYDKNIDKFYRYADCEEIGYIGQIDNEDVNILQTSNQINIINVNDTKQITQDDITLRYAYIVEFSQEDEN